MMVGIKKFVVTITILSTFIPAISFPVSQGSLLRSWPVNHTRDRSLRQSSSHVKVWSTQVYLWVIGTCWRPNLAQPCAGRNFKPQHAWPRNGWGSRLSFKEYAGSWSSRIGHRLRHRKCQFGAPGRTVHLLTRICRVTTIFPVDKCLTVAHSMFFRSFGWLMKTFCMTHQGLLWID